MKAPSPAQLAARKRFAEMARSGAFKKKATKRKANPDLYSGIYAKAQKMASMAKDGTLKIGNDVYKFTFNNNEWIYEVTDQNGNYVVNINEKNLTKAKTFLKNYLHNPSKRKTNPITETVIWGLAPGETRDYMEEIMYGGGQKLTKEQIDKVIAAATAAGYHSFRIGGIDMTQKPDFAGALNIRKKRKTNPVDTFIEKFHLGEKIYAQIIEKSDGTFDYYVYQMQATGIPGEKPYEQFFDTKNYKTKSGAMRGLEKWAMQHQYKVTPQLHTNPAKKTVSQKVSQLVHEGYPQRQAVAVALSEQRAGKVKRNPRPAKPKKYYQVSIMQEGLHKTWMPMALFLTFAEAENYANYLAKQHKNWTIRVHDTRAM